MVAIRQVVIRCSGLLFADTVGSSPGEGYKPVHKLLTVFSHPSFWAKLERVLKYLRVLVYQVVRNTYSITLRYGIVDCWHVETPLWHSAWKTSRDEGGGAQTFFDEGSL